MEKWRILAMVILIALSSIDLGLTYYYAKTYKTWQPDKSFNLIENNPLLVLLWNTFGLKLGMLIGSLIILSLIFIIGKAASPVVLGVIFFIFAYALFNHYANINLLRQLVTKYPLGIK